EDLVQRLLTLVVTAERAGAAAGPADRVDLVDEDDRRRDLASLAEQLADPARPDPDDRFDELRGGGREERHPGLARGGPREERLPGPRCALEQHALVRP